MLPGGIQALNVIASTLAGRERPVLMLGTKGPATVLAVRNHQRLDRPTDGVVQFHHELVLDARLHVEGDRIVEPWIQGGQSPGFVADRSGDAAHVHDLADGKGRKGDLIVSHGDKVVLVEVARLGDRSGLPATDRGERHVLDVVVRTVVPHPMNMAGEHRADVAGVGQKSVNALPVISVSPTKPPWVMQEDKDMCVVPGLLQRRFEPCELLGTHALGLGPPERPCVRSRIAFIGVEHDEHGILVFEGVPQRAEVHFVVALVLTLRARAFPSPVDVVVARHGEPGHEQLIHGVLELDHLGHPLGRLVVAIDQVADSHHEIRLDEVHILHSIGEHRDPRGGSTGPISEDGKHEGILLHRKFQWCTGPVRDETGWVRGGGVCIRVQRIRDIGMHHGGDGQDDKSEGVLGHAPIEPRWLAPGKCSIVSV